MIRGALILVILAAVGCGDARNEAKVTNGIIEDAERRCASFGGIDKFYFDGSSLEDLYCENGNHYGKGEWH
jgi:hypothetical protein